MKIYPNPQGTREWLNARLGIPTASRFSDIVTPSTLKASKSQTRYAHELLAGWLTGEPPDNAAGPFLERGTAFESQARDWYAFETDNSPVECGLCLTDDGKVGASPDALVGEYGLLEIKIPKASKHIGYVLDGPGKDHVLQIQGQILVAERDWLDFVSWNPVIPKVLTRFERDDKVQAALAEHLPAFCESLDAMKQALRDRGCVPACERKPMSFAEAEGIGDVSFEQMMETVAKFPST